MFGKCTEGKTRHKGVRHPFCWAVPFLPFLPDGFAFLVDTATRMAFPNFVIPSRSAATGMTARRWTAKPMGHTTVLRILRQCLYNMQVPKEVADRYTYNSCRRFLPTAAAVFHFGRDEAQALGSWVEEVTPETSKAIPALMSIHYSDEKALTSGAVKLKVLNAFVNALQDFPAAKEILNGGTTMIDPFCIAWADLKRKRKDEKGDAKQSRNAKKARKKEAKQEKKKKDKE